MKVFDIQHLCVHDGPGIRTTVFMSGCPLRCRWCHNPEGLSTSKILHYQGDKCISCMACASACQNQVHQVKEGRHQIERDKCISCGVCITECPAEALVFTTKEYETSQIVEEVLQDQDFYGTDGGVTFSGGEATMQSEALYETITELKKRNISIAIDTCGYTAWENLRRIASITDVFLFDIKGFDTDIHFKYTGVHNQLIKQNLRQLAQLHNCIWIRIPVIPNVNDSLIEIGAIGDFITELGDSIKQVTLMPYHKLGSAKYEMIGMEYLFDSTLTIKPEFMREAKDLLEQKGCLIR